MNLKSEKQIIVVSVLIILVLFTLFLTRPTLVSNDISTNNLNIEQSKIYNIDEVIRGDDISKCDYLKDETLIESCKLRLVKCNDDDCYLDKARFEMDEKLCYSIEDENKRILCTSGIKISSIKQRAVLEDNISICKEFESAETIEFCEDNYYIAKRFNDNNLEFCNQIRNEVIKDECLKEN